MSFGTASVCLSVLVLNFHHRGNTNRMPHWARTMFLHYFAKFLWLSINNKFPSHVRECPNNCKMDDADNVEVMEIQNILSANEKVQQCTDSYMINETLNYHNMDLAHITNSGYPDVAVATELNQQVDIIREWQLLARVLDRLFFVVVFIIMLSSACFILLSPWYTTHEIRR